MSAVSINYRLLGVSRTEPGFFVEARGKQFWCRGHMASFSLPGKSRTITVEPVEVPSKAPVAPEEVPKRQRDPDAPVERPKKKPEKVPS